MLISTSQLAAHLEDPSWIVFDCRHDLSDFEKGLRVYRAGHIPGAAFAAVETVLAGRKTGINGRHPLPSPEEFAAFLNRHGATESTQIVAYDDVGGQYAARLWWLARWIGLARVGVLDGGLPKWIAEGRAVTTEATEPRGSGTITARPNDELVIDVAGVLAAIGNRSALVMDARAAERFRGETETIDTVAGHIPSARNRFFKLNLNADLTMRPPEVLRREFAATLGEWKPERVVHQCGSGITACVNLFAMEYVGLGGSKLFVGSWSEWIADPSRPIARGA